MSCLCLIACLGRVVRVLLVKVIVTSYLFPGQKFSLQRLQTISSLVGKERLVVDIRYVLFLRVGLRSGANAETAAAGEVISGWLQ